MRGQSFPDNLPHGAGADTVNDADAAQATQRRAVKVAVQQRLDKRTTPDMPNYRPDAQYVREMKRYGILPPTFDLSKDPIDVFETDRAYWRSFWPRQAGDASGSPTAAQEGIKP
jgi:hypothetical protein